MLRPTNDQYHYVPWHWKAIFLACVGCVLLTAMTLGVVLYSLIVG